MVKLKEYLFNLCLNNRKLDQMISFLYKTFVKKVVNLSNKWEWLFSSTDLSSRHSRQKVVYGGIGITSV